MPSLFYSNAELIYVTAGTVQQVELNVVVTVHNQKAFDIVNCCYVFRQTSVCYQRQLFCLIWDFPPLLMCRRRESAHREAVLSSARSPSPADAHANRQNIREFIQLKHRGNKRHSLDTAFNASLNHCCSYNVPTCSKSDLIFIVQIIIDSGMYSWEEAGKEKVGQSES